MKKSSISNTFSAVFLQIITAISGLIIPQLIISNYGSTINGMISSITQFISYFTLVEAGVGNVSIFQLYKPLSENDKKEVNGILSATYKYYNKSGYFFLTLVFGLLFIYPHFISGQVDLSTVIWMICILSSSSIFDYFILGKYRVLLTADQKLYVLNYVQSLGTFLNTLFTVLLIYLNQSIIIVKLVSTLVYILRMVIVIIYVKKKYDYLDFHTTPLYEKLSEKWSVLSHQIAGMVVLNTDLVVLTIFKVPLSEISVYTVYNMILNVIINLLNSILTAMTPIFGNALSTKNKETIKKYYDLYELLFYILYFCLFTCLIVLYLPFLSVYSENFTDANYIRPSFVLVFSLMGLMYMVRTPALTIINACGHYRQTKKGAFIEAFINIVVSILLVVKFQIIGVIVGSICSHLFRSTELMIYNNRYLMKNTLKKTIKRVIRNILILIVNILFLNVYIIDNCASYIEWFYKAIIVVVFSSISIVLLNLLFERKYLNIIIDKLKKKTSL